MAQKKKQPLTHFKDFNTPKRSVYWHWSSQTRILPSCMKCCLIEQNIAHIWATSHTNEQNFARIVTFCVIGPYFSLVVHLFVCIQGHLRSFVCVYIQGVPKKVLIEQNHNQNWVLWGKILTRIWLAKAWYGLVLARNDQKINFHTQGVPVTCVWASALWLQQHCVSAFFGAPCTCDV